MVSKSLQKEHDVKVSTIRTWCQSLYSKNMVLKSIQKTTLVKYLLNPRMLKVQVDEEEEAALSLHENLKRTSLTVTSMEVALKMKAAEAREIEAKNAGDTHEHY